MGDGEKSVTAQLSVTDDAPELDALGYLTRSNLRVDALLTMQAAGPLDERELRAQYDVARTTVTRTLDGFADRGWVLRDGGTVQLTGYGDAVATVVREAVESLGAPTQVEPFLRRVPAAAFDLDPAALADADVTVAEPGSPYAPVEQVAALRRESSTVRELSSIVAQESAEQVYERAVAGDATFEIVLQSSVVDQIHETPSYREQFEETVAQDSVEVRVYDGVFPFLVVLLDEVVALGVTNEEELPAALVVSDAADVQSWAEDLYKQFYEAARPYEEAVA